MSKRGFPDSEYETRVARAQAMMAEQGLSALLLTTAPDVQYFTGFLTRFWESPTRPWYVIVPESGTPIAVIPSIGVPLMSQSWLTDIRSWRAPDYSDDGVSLLADALCEVTPKDGKCGVPSGMETMLRMPLSDWSQIQRGIGPRQMVSDGGIVKALRAVKSPAEVAKITAACAVANRAFGRVPEIATAGVALSQVFRDFQSLCLSEGADWVGYLSGAAGPGGYGDIIALATDAPLVTGDVLMLDTGVVLDGYYCDFDRNYTVGAADEAAAIGYDRLIAAADAAFETARPGTSAAELFAVMDQILTGGAGGSDAGRLGHGLGIQLTEGLSLIPDDHSPLQTGMVITLEPGIVTSAGQTLVHEENIVITEDGARYLSDPAPRELPVV